MAVSIQYDLDGSRFNWTNATVTWERRYLASGIAQADVPTMFGEVFDALPQPSTFAPDPFAGMRLTNRTIEELWKDGAANVLYAKGLIVYTFGDQTNRPVSSIGTPLTVTSFTEETEIDVNRDGTPITVEDSDGFVRGEKVSVSQARARIVYSRKEGDFPRNTIRIYTNAINAGAWNGFGDGTVRMESINVDTTNDGSDYIVVYQFIYKPEGWNAVRVVGTDLQTGKPIASPTGGQIAIVDPYFRTSFAGLNIILPT